MYYVKLFVSLLAFLFCINPPGSYAATSTPYEAKNIISNLHISGFAQDKSGVMWIATARGLCRYNGYEYIHFLHETQDPDSMPSDFTSSVYLDRDGLLWITTDKGVCRYNQLTNNFSSCTFDNDSLKPSFEYACIEYQGRMLVGGMNGIKTIDRETLLMTRNEPMSGYIARTMIEDDYYQLWIGGMVGQGIACLNKDLEILAHIPLDTSVDVLCSYKADNGDIWFGTNQGVVVVNPLSKKRIADTFSAKDSALLRTLRVKFFHKINDRTVLIGTENAGLFDYDPYKGELSASCWNDRFEETLSPHLTCCYTDRESNIWLGSFDSGFMMASNIPERFNNDKTLNKLFNGKFVTRIAEDSQGNLWIGTRYNGLIFFDTARQKTIEYNRHNFQPLIASNSNLIENVYIDSSGNLWVGNQKKIMQCRVNNGRIESYRVIDHSGPSTFMEDDYGRLWVGSSVDGITVYNMRNSRVTSTIRLDSKWNNITCIIKLRSGEMLISAYDDGLYIADPNDMNVRRLGVPEELAPLLDRTIYLFEDSRGNIWTGSYGKGAIMYNRSTGRYKVYSHIDGLPANNVLAIAEDEKGDIWMSTSCGIGRFDIEKRKFSSFFDYDGTGGNQFHEKSVLRSGGGRIYFGGNHGVTYFNAKDIIPLKKSIPVLLEDLKIMNVSEPIGHKNGVLDAHISQTGSITLNHRQNVFSIEYSGVDFSATKNIQYAYRLKNFDTDWNYVGYYRRAMYSNLSPGRYVFEVKAQNEDGYWNEIPTSLEVIIKAAPWRSSWAIMGYILLITLVILLCARMYINIKINRERLGMMEKERELEKEMSDLKIKFFTNISHELRTPLSMIYGPIKQLKSVYEDRNFAEYLMDLVNFNLDNIIRLIDQLMDFAKIESDTLSLSINVTDVNQTVGKLVDSYSFYAAEKGLEMKLNLLSPHLQQVAVDKDKISKIMSNLISNALKYTPSGGAVRIDIDVVGKLPEQFGVDQSSGDYLLMEVTDNGVGIKKEDLKFLFKRHQRLTRNDDYSKNVEGKGIGLNYIKQLVDKHNGKIVARQGEEGKGMVFSVAIPIDTVVYPAEGVVSNGTKHLLTAGVTDIGHDEEVPNMEISDDRRTIMVVEDNTELRHFLTRIFRDEYNVVSTSDGEKAVNKFADFNIDLVISDVLMPRMNGLELCSYIKNSPDICHIPVILLTAKTIIEDQMEGYSHGADIYITKPFDPILLKMIIRNMFVNMDRRSELILSSNQMLTQENAAISIGENKSIEMNPLDRKFFDRLHTMIDLDLSNCNLNINDIGREMAFSRTSFYRKIKALTGESPFGFLRVYRLNRAAELLMTQEYIISEIVDKTGFGTHSHFSACFKKQFGVSPKHYTGNKPDSESKKEL